MSTPNRISLALAVPGFIEGIRPTPELLHSDWADDKRRLSSKSTAETGKWKTSRTPYMREPMDCLSAHDPTIIVTLEFGTQLGKTEAGNNFCGYVIDHAPGPMLVVQPTIEIAKLWSRQRLAPMLDEMPCLREKIGANRSRDSANTTLLKDFPLGVLRIAGGNAAASLRAMPVRYLMLDEIDGYPFDCEGEGDPVELAERRRKTFTRSKQLETSTPTMVGTSRIDRRYLAGSQARYFVPCPECGEYHTFEIENLKYEIDDDGQVIESSVGMACPGCGSLIDEAHKTKMLRDGEWRHAKPKRKKHRSFRLSTLYSPVGWESWSDIADTYERAKSADELMKTFTNTILGMPFEESKKLLDWKTLKNRAESYPLGVCPGGCLVLCAGVDVQDDRLEVLVVGFREHEKWVIDRLVISGSPKFSATWRELDEYLAAPFEHAAGRELTISATAIDSGGHHTQRVYDFCRVRKARKIFPVKGWSQKSKPIVGKPSRVDIDVRGETIKKGGELWMVGTDTAKDQIYSWLELEAAEQEGYIHFSDELPSEFYKQLTAEKKAPRYVRGFLTYDWMLPKGTRNEMLDCCVYAIAAFWRLGLNRWRRSQWRQLESRVQPETGDLFDAASSEEKAETRTKQVDQVAPRRSRSRSRPGGRRKSSFSDGVLSG